MRFAFLPLKHLQEVLALTEERRSKMFIQVIMHHHELIGVTGNFEVIKVPVSFFTPSGDGTTPDFNDVRIDDYGHTVCFGIYEAATDAIIEFSHTSLNGDCDNGN